MKSKKEKIFAATILGLCGYGCLVGGILLTGASATIVKDLRKKGDN